MPAKRSEMPPLEKEVDTLRTSVAALRRRLTASENRFLAILNDLPYPILIHRQAVVVYINPAGAKILGAERPGIVLGRPLAQFAERRTHEEIEALARRLAAGQPAPPQLHRGAFLRLDGRRIEVEWLDSRVEHDGLPALGLVFRDITADLRMAAALRQSEERYRSLVELSPVPIFVHREGAFLYLNPAALALFGDPPLRSMVGRQLADFVHPQDRERFEAHLAEVTPDDAPAQNLPVRLDPDNGGGVDVELTAISIRFDANPARLVICQDVTARRAAEAELHASRKELAQKALHLEEANRALKLMLDHRQIEKRAVEENLVAGMKKFVFPYLDKLAGSELAGDGRTYLNILRTNLEDLLAPMRHRRFARYADLTPTEVEIADLIRQGRSSKEIAHHLNVSTSAVSFHRNNIRRKFGLLNRGTNLQAYLNSLGA